MLRCLAVFLGPFRLQKVKILHFSSLLRGKKKQNDMESEIKRCTCKFETPGNFGRRIGKKIRAGVETGTCSSFMEFTWNLLKNSSADTHLAVFNQAITITDVCELKIHYPRAISPKSSPFEIPPVNPESRTYYTPMECRKNVHPYHRVIPQVSELHFIMKDCQFIEEYREFLTQLFPRADPIIEDLLLQVQQLSRRKDVTFRE